MILKITSLEVKKIARNKYTNAQRKKKEITKIKPNKKKTTNKQINKQRY